MPPIFFSTTEMSVIYNRPGESQGIHSGVTLGAFGV